MAKQTSLRFYPYSQSDSGSSSCSSTHRSIDSDSSESLCGLGPRKKAHTAEKPAARHRQSGYNLEWGKSFPWLEYSPAENGLYCSLCISHQRTNARCSIWIKEPCRQLRREVSLNCDYLRELIVSGNAHYTSHRIINEFVHVLSACVEEDTLTNVKLYFLSDVLPQLSKLSLVFQAASVDFSLIKPQVSVTIATIKRFKTVSGPFYKTVDEALKKLDIHFTPENKEAFEHQIAHKYVDAVVSNLEDRFPDTKLLSAFSVFDPQQVPQENEAEFGTYGNEHIDTLSDNFQLTIDKETLEIEWLSFKEMFKNQVAELSTTEVMHSLIKPSVSTIYPQLANLANIGLIITVSTATCEHGFSAMKRIKTNLRNRLIAKTLDCLMRISIDGPDLDCFDFVTAATKWASIKKRRITV